MPKPNTNKPPAFQFYPGDWLASTKISLMTPAEEGAFIRLLCHAWSDPQCSLVDDDDVLTSLSRLGPEWFNGASTKIRACFKKKGNRLYSVRLKIEREKQKEWRKKSQLGGLNSGKSRKQKDLEGKGGSDLLESKDKPKGNTSSSSSSSSSSSLKRKKNKGIVSDEDNSCPSLQKLSDQKSDAYRLSKLLSDLILKNNPHSRLHNSDKEKVLQRWAKDIDLLIRKDGQQPLIVEEVMRFATADGFWGPNILSGAKLREKWDTLVKTHMKRKGVSTSKANSQNTGGLDDPMLGPSGTPLKVLR